MDKVTIILVGGTSDIDKTITNVTGGVYSHVAGILFDSTFEATGIKEENDPYAGAWLHKPKKYDNNPYAKFIEVEIPDIEALKNEARNLLGRRYAYLGCAEGALHDLLGLEISIASDFAVNCSELWTRLLRAGGKSFINDVPADCVTPYDFAVGLGVDPNERISA